MPFRCVGQLSRKRTTVEPRNNEIRGECEKKKKKKIVFARVLLLRNDSTNRECVAELNFTVKIPSAYFGKRCLRI